MVLHIKSRSKQTRSVILHDLVLKLTRLLVDIYWGEKRVELFIIINTSSETQNFWLNTEKTSYIVCTRVTTIHNLLSGTTLVRKERKPRNIDYDNHVLFLTSWIWQTDSLYTTQSPPRSNLGPRLSMLSKLSWTATEAFSRKSSLPLMSLPTAYRVTSDYSARRATRKIRSRSIEVSKLPYWENATIMQP